MREIGSVMWVQAKFGEGWKVVREVRKSSESSQSHRSSRLLQDSLGTEDLKTFPRALYLFFHLSLSFSLSL